MSMHKNHVEGFIKHRLFDAYSEFDLASFGWGSRMCIYNKFQVMLILLIPGTHIKNQRPVEIFLFRWESVASLMFTLLWPNNTWVLLT